VKNVEELCLKVPGGKKSKHSWIIIDIYIITYVLILYSYEIIVIMFNLQFSLILFCGKWWF